MNNKLQENNPLHLRFGWLLVVPALLFAINLTAQDEEELEEFTITGSQIPTTETAYETRPTPMQVLERFQIDQTGFVTAEELLQKLTANNAGSVAVSNNATGFTSGATSASLRGLGPEATLVLINGRRAPVFPTGTNGTDAFVDLNSIPASAIQRIEVLKDGASATYGADAVAGVINIIMRDDYEGGELTVRYGNDSGGNDSSEFLASVVYGVKSEKGSITVGANWYTRNPIFNGDNDFSLPPFLSSNSSPLNIAVSAEAVRDALGLAPTADIPFLEGQTIAQDDVLLSTSGPTDAFGAPTAANQNANNQGNVPVQDYFFDTGFGNHSRFNFNEQSGSFPETTRVGGFMNFRYDLFGTDNVETYGYFSYQNAEADNQLAPSATGSFQNPGGVSLVIPANTADPIIRPDRTGRIPEVANGAFNEFNPFNQDLEGFTRIRLFDFGNRKFLTKTEAFNVHWGMRATNLFNKWNADFGFGYGLINETNLNTLVSISTFNRLVNSNDSFFDPSSSDFTGTTTAFNPFVFWKNPLPNNQLLAPLGLVEQKNRNESELLQSWGSINTAELFNLPGGGVGFAAGWDWRQEQLFQSPDSSGSTGDVIGSSTAAITRGRRRVGSAFWEMSVPVISPEMDSWVHSLEFNLGGRYEKFLATGIDTYVSKFSVRLAPVEELVFRASWGEGFRQPSLYELFSTATFSLTPIANPVTGRFEQEQDVVFLGNSALSPEDTESWNLGVVYSPKFIKGATVSVDFWNVKRVGTVGFNAQDTVRRFFANEPLFPGEQVDTDINDEIILLTTVFQNSGRTDVKGLDFSASYLLQTENWGTFSFSVNATKLLKFQDADAPGLPRFDFVGFSDDVDFRLVDNDQAAGETIIGPFGNQTQVVSQAGSASDAQLEWKFNQTLTWNWRNFSSTISGYFTDGFVDFDEAFPPNWGNIDRVHARWIWDVQSSYTFFKDSEKWWGGTTITVGVDNLFAQKPPSAFANFGNTQGYPSFLYTAEVQFLWISIKKKL